MLELSYVTNVSTQKEKKGKDPRVFATDEVARRNESHKIEARQGAETPFGLITLMFARRKRIPAEILAGKLPRQAAVERFLFRFGKNGTPTNRFAAIVGVKFEKSSVKRHYWKRQILERLKTWPELGLDVAVTPQKEAKKLSAREATMVIEGAYKKII